MSSGALSIRSTRPDPASWTRYGDFLDEPHPARKTAAIIALPLAAQFVMEMIALARSTTVSEYPMLLGDVLAFTLVCLAMACTPGPNMMYLVSRSVSQGTNAGIIS